MPCLRGIEVSLTTKPDDEQIPEYPHPDGTSARILGTLSNYTNGQVVHRKAGPTVAVYIPSIPGTQFAINYSINTAPAPPCKYVFFRLYINARPIAAWGVDPTVRPQGRVIKSLWAPSTLHHNQIGFEGRNFVFLPGEEYKSVAEDGGLIEIQVFRAKERRARAPRLEEFRFQENHGIAAPSIGLLNEPQDACFYDWHLLDAKDSPFASFRFHYRSWKNLKQLNLVPESELKHLCIASPKALRVIAKADDHPGILERNPGKDSPQSGHSDEAVFHDCKEDPDDGGAEEEEDTGYYFLKSPPEIFPAVPSDATIPQPSKELRDADRESYLQRPLPELPVETSSRISRRSSAASALSATLSITPSLQQYLDEGHLDPEEIEVGVAQLVQLPASEPTLRVNHDDEPTPADGSISDYETSPKSTDDSFLGEKLSPSRYLPITGSGLERGIALFTSPKRSISARASKSRQSLPGSFHPLQDPSRWENMTPSELDCVNGGPSPSPSKATDKAARRESSSQTDRGGNKSLFAGLRKGKLLGSPSKLAGIILGRDIPALGDGGITVPPAKGNWV